MGTHSGYSSRSPNHPLASQFTNWPNQRQNIQLVKTDSWAGHPFSHLNKEAASPASWSPTCQINLMSTWPIRSTRTTRWHGNSFGPTRSTLHASPTSHSWCSLVTPVTCQLDALNPMVTHSGYSSRSPSHPLIYIVHLTLVMQQSCSPNQTRPDQPSTLLFTWPNRPPMQSLLLSQTSPLTIDVHLTNQARPCTAAG